MSIVDRRFLFVLAVFFSGCASSQPVGGKVAGAPDSDVILAKALEGLQAEKQEYKISPQDQLSISVYQEEDLKRDVRVSQNGKISFPLVGELEVGGLTTLEAQAKLASLLKAYLIEPHVALQIKDFHSRKVFVLGEVSKPGSYEIPSDQPLTVVEAVALAGGMSKIAAAGKTRVVRNTGSKIENIVVPVDEVTRGEKEKDVMLQPGDVVFVPQTFF